MDGSAVGGADDGCPAAPPQRHGRRPPRRCGGRAAGRGRRPRWAARRARNRGSGCDPAGAGRSHRGPAVLRLLTGARWRLGAADLEALAQRSRELATARTGPAATGTEPRPGTRVRSTQLSDRDGGGAWPVEDIDTRCTGRRDRATPAPATDYSAEGYRRINRFAARVGPAARAGCGQPLPDLIADLERATGLDIEVQLGSRRPGRAHLDAFAGVVAEVAATGAGPGGAARLPGRRGRAGGRPGAG